jgi:sterol desaturase/sphingolipid hydroxylase (fatty acid hydroxylase superfamily)
MGVTDPAFSTVFTAAFTVVVLRAVLLAGGATLFLRTSLAKARRVYLRAFGKGQLWSELRAGMLALLFDAAAFALFRTQGWFVFAEPTPARNAFSFFLMAVWFEVWFYATHRAMHHKALYRLHAQHHVAKVTHPLTSLSFGLVERGVLFLGSLGFAALVSHLVPITLPGILSYLLVNYALNVWGHLNVELLPAGYGRSWLSRIFISTSFHALHHARYTGHYGLFTTVLDRWLGTAWDDYPEVHARAAAGQGLATMGERATAGAAAPEEAVARAG